MITIPTIEDFRREFEKAETHEEKKRVLEKLECYIKALEDLKKIISRAVLRGKIFFTRE
ncbi:hypothetical protein LJ207_03165 [Halanaerobium sp. Z-7514]|uniref:Uncharacterized protein n=1 Tax=Halanaerobium polyolivorans TaxID=2886943 RepID=A0AAW4WYS4_9FIRM|nr:hypothetical protein [Halanaerobium polyolivorans]MCC3144319.1 hypothetical protein [Halanaerobium polyolivorans]